MTGELLVGTSGFAYKEWKPDFYPADLKAADFLRHYSSVLPSVEINNTFYKSPTEKLLRSWVEQTPETFRFTLKAPQRITHRQRLREVDESLGYFLGAARALDSRLGCILFQCPPSLRYEGALLDAFLAALPGEPFRFAMEFRHATWDTQEVRDKLAANNVAWCVADTDQADAPLIQTAGSFVYLRLRKEVYREEDLGSWSNQSLVLLRQGIDVYTYFKHEDDWAGARFALRFRELAEGG